MTVCDRRSLPLLAMFALAMWGVSCSGGASSTPTAPTAPIANPAPAPTPPATPRANLIAIDAIDFLSCVNGLCSFRGNVLNTGNACAVNISGESWIISAQGQEVARVRWTLPRSTVMRPGDSVYFFGQGMPQTVLNHLDGRSYASFVFESREC